MQSRLLSVYKPEAEKAQEEGKKKGGETGGRGRPKDSSSTTYTKAKQDDAKRAKHQAAAATGYSAATLAKVEEAKQDAAKDRQKEGGKKAGRGRPQEKVPQLIGEPIADPHDQRTTAIRAKEAGTSERASCF